MQTFLPYASFTQSARVLDMRRLGKQRVEARMILNILINKRQVGWAHHPAVRMWRGYEDALAAYYNCCIREWIHRGYKNTLLRQYFPASTHLVYPKWFGGKIHSNHRLALLYKAQRKFIHKAVTDELDWYAQFHWAEDSDILYEDLCANKPFEHYYWPVT